MVGNVTKPWHLTWYAGCKPQHTTYADGGFTSVNSKGRSDFAPPPLPGIEPALDWRRKTDVPTKPKPPLVHPQSTRTLNLETNPIASDRQSLAPDLSRPQSLDGSPSDEMPLSHSDNVEALLDQAPFITMDNRYKLLKATSEISADCLGDGLSQLRQQCKIHSFSQISLDGIQGFTVAVR